MDIAANITSIVSITAATSLIVLAGWWLAIVPRIAVILLCVSLVAGQLIRISLPGQGGGLLVSDLAIVGILWVAGATYVKGVNHAGQARILLIAMVPFVVWSLFGIMVHLSDLSSNEIAITFLYWVRLVTHLLLLPALALLVGDKEVKATLVRWFSISVGLLIAFGFIQLFLIPQLANVGVFGIPADILQRAGWDPHVGRLVSTWLDPNFFGAFLIAAIPFVVLRHPATTWKVIWSVAGLIALAATQSRSALVGFAGVVCTLILIYWLRVPKNIPIRRLVQSTVLVSVFILWLGFMIGLLGERFINVFSFDPTVELRQESLKAVWNQLVIPSPIIGVGYNAYQFAAQKEGLISSFAMHSRAGADNSFITLWVTTGLVGVILFLIPWAYILHQAISGWIVKKQGLALAAIVSVVGIIIHSQFVNSFLYSHLLIVLAVVCAVSLKPIEPKRV